MIDFDRDKKNIKRVMGLLFGKDMIWAEIIQGYPLPAFQFWIRKDRENLIILSGKLIKNYFKEDFTVITTKSYNWFTIVDSTKLIYIRISITLRKR